MWKFQDFSVTQILREINFGESRSSKTAGFFSILGALSFVNWVNFKLHKCKNSLKSKFRAKRCVKMADFAHLIPPKLISRKI